MTNKIAVLSASARQKTFGTFAYEELSGGSIKIDPRWVEGNMVECRLPKASGKGKDVVTMCHVLVKDPLEHAFEEIAARGLWKLIHSFDGLWVPRHMTWNPSRPLSSHSWGIAFDLNASNNPYGGGVSPENRALNEVFNRYGFAWGGDWNTSKDAMHWELADVEAWKSAPASKTLRLVLAVKRSGGYSYHVLSGAVWKNDHFEVDGAAVAQVLGTPQQKGAASVTSIPLRAALESARADIVEVGDHRDDPHDPRYYVFVRAAVQAKADK